MRIAPAWQFPSQLVEGTKKIDSNARLRRFAAAAVIDLCRSSLSRAYVSAHGGSCRFSSYKLPGQTTLWTGHEAMSNYMLSGAHRQAMPQLFDWCDEAAVAHWMQEGMDLSPWPELYARLQKEGRRSKVRHSSPAHIEYRIAQPIRPDAERRFK